MHSHEQELSELRAQHARLAAELAGVKRSLALRGVAGPGLERRFRVDQLRNPNGQWIFEGGRKPLAHPAFAPALAPLVIEGLAGAVLLYNQLRSGPGERRVMEFRARDYHVAEGAFEPTFAGTLTEEQTRQACPRLEKVQGMLDKATTDIDGNAFFLSPAQRGTAIHKMVADEINGPGGVDQPRDPNFRAEQSLLKSGEIDVRYGTHNSLRIDVFDRLLKEGKPRTVCVYDVKTGFSNMSAERVDEIASRIRRTYPDTNRIVVSETRPTS